MKANEFTEQYNGGKGPGSDYRAYDEPDQSNMNNYAVHIDGKKWKVFGNQQSANRAASTIQQKYNKKTQVFATIDPVSEAKSSAREKLVKDFEKIAGYKINDKEAWYQAVNDYYKGKRDSWPDPREFGLEESVETITEEQFDEAAGEKDACYHKVKSRYKVWPSAYASGALVQCRKVGAKNWGNKSKKK